MFGWRDVMYVQVRRFLWDLRRLRIGVVGVQRVADAEAGCGGCPSLWLGRPGGQVARYGTTVADEPVTRLVMEELCLVRGLSGWDGRDARRSGCSAFTGLGLLGRSLTY